jgi:hypothetical protein
VNAVRIRGLAKSDMTRRWGSIRARLLLTALCVVCLLVPAAGAAAQPDPQEQLDEVQERLERTQEGIQELDRERGVTIEQLERLDAELAEVEASLAALQAELAAAEQALAEAEERLAATTAKLEATRERLARTEDRLAEEEDTFAERTRSSFMYGGPAQLTTSMFSAGDAAHFGRAIQYVERVMANDRDRVTLVAGLVREIEADTFELGILQAREADERAAAEAERNRVAVLVDEERALREQVVAQRAERQAALRTLLRSSSDLKMIVEQLNFTIFDNTRGERFITFFLGYYNYKQEKLTYVNAGHNPPVLCWEGEGKTELLEAGTTILGAFEHLPFLELGERTALKDFTIHLYTDGLTETFNSENEEYGEERFVDFIKNESCPSPQVFHEQFFGNLKNFSQGVPRKDDITLLSLKFC